MYGFPEVPVHHSVLQTGDIKTSYINEKRAVGIPGEVNHGAARWTDAPIRASSRLPVG